MVYDSSAFIYCIISNVFCTVKIHIILWRPFVDSGWQNGIPCRPFFLFNTPSIKSVIKCFSSLHAVRDKMFLHRVIFLLFCFIYVLNLASPAALQIPLCLRMLGLYPGLLRHCQLTVRHFNHSAWSPPQNEIQNWSIFTVIGVDHSRKEPFKQLVYSCSARDWERSGLLEENPQSGCSDICASLKGPL